MALLTLLQNPDCGCGMLGLQPSLARNSCFAFPALLVFMELRISLSEVHNGHRMPLMASGSERHQLRSLREAFSIRPRHESIEKRTHSNESANNIDNDLNGARTGLEALRRTSA